MFEGCRKMPLAEIQTTQLELMKLIHKVCVKHNIRYYIIAGTMLGAVRHGGFIPWDDDIDIAMAREEFENFKQIFNQEFDNSKYFLQHYGTDPYFQPALMRVLMLGTVQDIPSEYHLKHRKESYLDIFPLDNAPDTIEERKVHARQIKKIDRLIELRYYKVYNGDNALRRFVKASVAALISLIPKSYLRKKRLAIMSKYDEHSTSRLVSTVSQYRYEKQAMLREFYGTPTLVKFEDAEFYGPEQADRYLKQLYGENYMQVPPVEKRRTPTDVYIKL